MVAAVVGLAPGFLTGSRAPPSRGALRMQQKFGAALCPLLDDVPSSETCASLTFGMG